MCQQCRKQGPHIGSSAALWGTVPLTVATSAKKPTMDEQEQEAVKREWARLFHHPRAKAERDR